MKLFFSNGGSKLVDIIKIFIYVKIDKMWCIFNY